jgi:PAS domain S-box-containing protein
MLTAAARDDDHLGFLQRFELSSSIVVPLRARDRVLGAIRLLGTKGRYFDESDVQLALDLGQRAAVAIENAQLHHALLEQATELRLSHAAAKMGSWTWDLEHDRLSWSPEFKALHGLPEDAEATSEAAAALVHPDDREEAQQAFQAALESSASIFNSEHRSLTPDGRILWLQVRGRIRRDASGKAIWIAGLVIDVTDSRMAEQALRRAEKLAAAGRLAATVAHEVNNPLEALVNAIYLAQHAKDLGEAADHLRLADSELRRITHIVRQTLGFYRESTLPQPTGLLQLVSEVLDLYRTRSLSRGVTLRTGGETVDEIFVKLIAGEMKQVIANLIANAIDATPAGGMVETSVLRCDDWVEILVSDTGCGISEANRKHLFEPFFTTKADVGTGLGLWVSKGIVEKHGGSITVESKVEQGTTFRVRLVARS